MPFSSLYADLEIPKTDLLTHLFPPGTEPSDTPIWIDSADPREYLTPRQLLQWVKRLALGLDRLGVRRGEAVMIHTPNHIFVPVSYLGIVGSGRIFSGANPIYTVSELTHQIENTGAQVILAHPSLVKTTIAAAKAAGLPNGRVFLFSDRPNAIIEGVEAVDWRTMIANPADADRYKWHKMTEQESMSTIATVNYSSGTTGLPKGVCVSHYNLIANLEQTIFIRFHNRGYGPHNRKPERWVGFLPLYHAYGQLYVNIMAVRLDIPVYVMKQFQFEDYLRIIQTHKITTLQVAPPILVMLSKRPETAKYDLSSVTDVLCGAAPLSKELQNEVASKVGCRILQGWGMTELTCGAIMIPGGDDDFSGSVGYLFPNTDCKLLDDDGKEVGAGQPGEIHLKGPHVCLSYWRNEAATKECLSDDGWLKTGDVAIVRDGKFWIVDRKKELIKVNALQVAPAELEAVLLEHEAIADAAVVGITLHGEEWPRAYVHLKENYNGKTSAEDIQEFMRAKVAKYKQLVGGIMFVDEVPRLASGKITRKTVKEWAARDAKELGGKIKARL